MGRRALTREDVIARIEKHYPEEYDYSKLIYRHSHTDFTLICSKHKEFTSNVISLRQAIKNGKPLCNYCNGEVFFDEELYREELKEYTWPKGLVIVKFLDKHCGEDARIARWVTLKHTCGHVFDRRAKRVRIKSFVGCPKCTKQRAPIRTGDDFIRRVRETGNENLIFPGLKWRGMGFEVEGYCCKHKVNVKATAQTFIYGHGCYACGKENKQALKERFGKIREKKVGEGK